MKTFDAFSVKPRGSGQREDQQWTGPVFFQADSEAQLESFQQRLSQYLDRHSVATQGHHINKALRRVVYDAISYDAVQWLKEHPPMMDHMYYVAEQYHFVQPIYGIELAISGLREI